MQLDRRLVQIRAAMVSTGVLLGALVAPPEAAAQTPPPPPTTGTPAPGSVANPPPPPTPAGAAGLPSTGTAEDEEEAKEEAEEAEEDRASSSATLAELQTRISEAEALASRLRTKISLMTGKNELTVGRADALVESLNSWVTLLKVSRQRAALLAERERPAKALKGTEASEQRRAIAQDKDALRSEIVTAKEGLSGIAAQLQEIQSASGWKLVETILRARCATAICFDNGSKKDWLGIEPLVELPVGKSFALSNSALSDYVNNHELRVDLAAGVRVWLFRDVVSVSMYISKPLTDAPVRLEGSAFIYPASSVRRPYPGFAIGGLFDSIWFGFDRDELRNGDGQDGAALNPDFPPNEVVSSGWTLTVALQPVTAFRTAIGTAVKASEEKSK